MSYHVDAAYTYYVDHILGPLRAKTPFYEERQIPMEGLVSFRDWEVFAAILTDDKGSALRSGSDLGNHEVKSAKKGGSFEYQYHRNHGREKLEHDLAIEHLFVVYESNYQNVDVYVLGPEQFTDVAESWREQLVEAYANPRNQRFRKSVSYGKVIEEGTPIMQIRDGSLISG